MEALESFVPLQTQTRNGMTSSWLQGRPDSTDSGDAEDETVISRLEEVYPASLLGDSVFLSKNYLFIYLFIFIYGLFPSTPKC